ncbi:hypothetical protein Cde04nite_35990 [Cellulomonas denverensis]|nr:hypothetical protein Cde04nite_35990 [Cellulomonas denverensis]
MAPANDPGAAVGVVIEGHEASAACRHSSPTRRSFLRVRRLASAAPRVHEPAQRHLWVGVAAALELLRERTLGVDAQDPLAPAPSADGVREPVTDLVTFDRGQLEHQ